VSADHALHRAPVGMTYEDLLTLPDDGLRVVDSELP
jgi:hypothetical protein